MKKNLLLVGVALGIMLLGGCGDSTSEIEMEATTEEIVVDTAIGIITDNNWRGEGGSYLVCEEDGTYNYYKTSEDLTNNYYEGTYEFYMGEEAVTYVTEDLSQYSVTRQELEELFMRNEDYDASNFVCLVLNHNTRIMDGENTLEEPTTAPHYGFLLENEGTLYLDVANMNTGNYYLFTGTD